MRLINDFFEIIAAEQTETALRNKIRLNADHRIYQVHFPGNPITPGVCLIRIVTELLSQHCGKKLQLQTAGNIKFKQPVYPSDTPSFVFTHMNTNDEGQLSVRVSIEDGETQYAKMSLIYETVCNHTDL